MKRKLFLLIAGLAVVVFGIYYQGHLDNTAKVLGITYDRSVKVEYGVPIKVVQVIDGDTVVLVNGDHLRYIGMDTPEEFDQRKPVQCFAKEAAEKNRELVEGKMIKFYKDVDTKDKYGRWLGFVYLEDGTFVNEELVKEGFAFAYPYKPDVSKAAVFKSAETLAKNSNLGLWAKCAVTILKSGREQTNAVE